MTAQTPGCGSTSDARKRAAEETPTLYDALTHHGRAFGAATGDTVAEGIIVAVADRPTYILVTETGERFHWMAHLVEVGDPASDDEYAAMVERPHPAGTVFGGQPASVDTEALAERIEPETVDGQANDCTHTSATGVDTTSPRDPAKVWACDHCGLRWRTDGAPVAESGGLRKALEDLLDQWESQHSHLGVERGKWGPSSSSLRALLASHSTEGAETDG